MAKKIIYSLLFIFLLTSCGSTKDLWYANSNIKKVKLGMTKDQAIKTMGKSYKVISANTNKNRQVEVLGWDTDNEQRYALRFVDNKLENWKLERIKYRDRDRDRDRDR